MHADFLVCGTVITMDSQRRIVSGGAVAVGGHEILDVGSERDLSVAYPDAVKIGSVDDLVTPGYLNGHQHLTGDRLIQSAIPDKYRRCVQVWRELL